MYRPAIPEVVEAVQRMAQRCNELGISLPVAALAFVLTEALVDLTIVGLARPEEVYWNLPACEPGVSRADLESVREAGRIDPVLIGGPDFRPVPAGPRQG
jgi:D-threo-aldose 1-dehydrogenase